MADIPEELIGKAAATLYIHVGCCVDCPEQQDPASSRADAREAARAALESVADELRAEAWAKGRRTGLLQADREHGHRLTKPDLTNPYTRGRGNRPDMMLLPPCAFPDCRNRACTRASGLCKAHLAQRARGTDLSPLRPRATAETCAHGHPWTAETTVLTRSGHRRCRTCIADTRRRARERRATTEPAPEPVPAPPQKRRKKSKSAKSKLPKGWYGPAKQRRDPANTNPVGGKGIESLPPTPPLSQSVVNAALACLARHDALDLADTLGIPTKETA